MTHTRSEHQLIDLGDYPGLLGAGASRTVGELYEVDDAQLAELDAFEGHPELFRRTELTLANGARASVYLYVAGAAGRPRLEHDDWNGSE